MSGRVDPKELGEALAPLLAAESDPVRTGLDDDAVQTPVNAYFREEYFQRVYDPHGEFRALEIHAKDTKTLEIRTHLGPGAESEYVFITPPEIPKLTERLERHGGRRWQYHRVQVTDHPGGYRNLELNTDADGVRLVDISPEGRTPRKEWASVRVDPEYIPEFSAALEQAHQELAHRTPFTEYYDDTN